jgi:hypothetical protein
MARRPDATAAAARATFEHSGFFAVPALFSRVEVARVRAWVDEIQRLPEQPGRQMMYFDANPAAPGGRLLNRVENFTPFHPGLATVVNGEKLLALVSSLFGEPAVLFKDKINFKLPGGGGFEPHQDSQAGWGDYATLFITAAVAVDSATRENGCLELAHWSHRRELIGPLWQPLGAEQLAGIEFEPLPMEPGDAVFFDSFLPHRSGPNPTAEARRVLYLTYNRASEGDHRARYYADKRKSYPPDCEREPGRVYAYKV